MKNYRGRLPNNPFLSFRPFLKNIFLGKGKQLKKALLGEVHLQNYARFTPDLTTDLYSKANKISA